MGLDLTYLDPKHFCCLVGGLEIPTLDVSSSWLAPNVTLILLSTTMFNRSRDSTEAC